MPCSEIRAALPGFVYGELNPDDVRAVEDHVAACPVCRAELAELQQVNMLLHKLPVPVVRVDVPAIVKHEQLRRERRLRSWRRAAVAMTGIAAAALLLVFLKLEIRVDHQELVLRWGDVPEPTVTAAKPGPATTAKPAPEQPRPKTKSEVTRTDLRLLRELIHALAADVNGRDQQQQEAVARLQGQVDRLERDAQERWTATVRYVAANSRPEDQEKEGANP